MVEGVSWATGEILQI